MCFDHCEGRTLGQPNLRTTLSDNTAPPPGPDEQGATACGCDADLVPPHPLHPPYPAAPGTDHNGEVERPGCHRHGYVDTTELPEPDEVETVARAIYEEANPPDNPWCESWGEVGGFARNRYRRLARAALAARRPATEAEEAVKRVRELHHPQDGPYGQECATCIGSDECGAPWPCPTFAALGAAADGDGRG